MIHSTPHPKKAAFLAAYARCGIIAYACRIADIDRKTYYNWCEHDDAFAVGAKLAYAEAGDYLEEVALQRATIGTSVVKEIWEGDVLVRREVSQQVSDTMLAMMLNGAKPEKYKQRHDIHHSGVPAVKILPDEAWRAL